MTLFSELPDDLLDLLTKIVSGAVDSAARDAEAVFYGNGVDSTSLEDMGMRNGIAHVHKSAELARKYGGSTAELLGRAL
ncbi:MAG: hypothetical protein AB2806_00895 [Candidatus Thiodiazotropha sp.]